MKPCPHSIAGVWLDCFDLLFPHLLDTDQKWNRLKHEIRPLHRCGRVEECRQGEGIVVVEVGSFLGTSSEKAQIQVQSRADGRGGEMTESGVLLYSTWVLVKSSKIEAG